MYFVFTFFFFCSETRGREKVTLVVDFKSFSQLTGMSQIKISQEFMRVLSDHMPGMYPP